MLLFATSDKGGTGRSVTSANVCYRRALQGSDVAYLDFDFGSPTAGSILSIPRAQRGTSKPGMHQFLRGRCETPDRIDIWEASERPSLRGRPAGAGKFVLFPGDEGGGEFASSPDIVRRCVDLFRRLDEEFDICLVDLSAGRSYAVDIVLAATADDQVCDLTCRWLVFHRWTNQHVIAAHGLVHGINGILDNGERRGHDRTRMIDSVRFVRTAVVDPNASELAGLRAEQIAWLREFNGQLQELASRYHIGRTRQIGSVPLDPVLQWREQLISDADVMIRQNANRATVDAFNLIAKRLDDEETWTSL